MEFFKAMYWEEPIPESKKSRIFDTKMKQTEELVALQESNRVKAANKAKENTTSPTKIVMIER